MLLAPEKVPMTFFIKIYQSMASGSNKVVSIRAILANFDFLRNPASRPDFET